jgi:gliding motility-associated-like protein
MQKTTKPIKTNVLMGFYCYTVLLVLHFKKHYNASKNQNNKQLKAKWVLSHTERSRSVNEEKSCTLSFEIDNYNPNLELIIDPVTRLWGTYYGGSNTEQGRSCSTDASGNVYLAGYTGSNSGTIIATAGAHQSANGGGSAAFLVKFNTSGVRQWGTYYGGSGVDYGHSCSTDATGNVYLAGSTDSNTGTVIATAGAHQSAYGGGNNDAFLVKFNASGIRQWGTYYGGSGIEAGYSCSTDASGNVYLAGDTPSNTGTVIATTGAHQSAYGGGGTWDAFLVKFFDCDVSALPTVTAASSNTSFICVGTNATLTATSAGNTIVWNGGSLTNVANPAVVNQAGTYTVTATNPSNGCSNTAIVSVTASPMFTSNITVLSQINCFGANNGALQVNVSGGSMPFTITNLNNNNTLSNINTFPLTLNNLSAGNYSIQVSDASGCQQVLYSSISQPLPLNVLVTGNSSLCAGSSASLSSNASGGTAPYNFMWSPNGGTAPNTFLSPNVSTTYTLTVTDNNDCKANTNFAIAVNPTPGANVINNKLVGCAPVCASFSLAQNQNGNYNYNWVFTSSAPSPTVINFNQYNPQLCFTKEGVYTANVSITTAQGCTTTITYTNLVTVYPKPIADFYYSPTNPTILEPKVSFTNTTVGASQFSWYNVNDLFSQQTNPSFTFQDPGKFLVTLIAGDGNCSDTISKYVVIEDDFSFYIPNAFTPDENNLNDYFYPVMRGYTDKNYVFMIFDRWGELIFKTNDTESKGWDGYYKNQLCKDDAYTWRVYVTDKRSKGHEFTGHVVLMK